MVIQLIAQVLYACKSLYWQVIIYQSRKIVKSDVLIISNQQLYTSKDSSGKNKQKETEVTKKNYKKIVNIYLIKKNLTVFFVVMRRKKTYR